MKNLMKSYNPFLSLRVFRLMVSILMVSVVMIQPLSTVVSSLTDENTELYSLDGEEESGEESEEESEEEIKYDDQIITGFSNNDFGLDTKLNGDFLAHHSSEFHVGVITPPPDFS